MDLEKIIDEETKLCPECAENIKFKAKKCRYCQAMLDSDEVDRQVENRRAELLAKEKEEALANEREGKTQCPHCENWDVYKTITNDYGYSDWCPYCKQPLKSMGVVDEEKPLTPKKPSVLENVLYIIVWFIVIVGIITSILIPTKSPQPNQQFYLIVWIGIVSAWTAKRKGKSGWLWFFIGFIGIGFTTLFCITFFQALIGGHEKPINAKLIKMKPVFENASVQKLQGTIIKLNQIKDLSTIQNINKAIKIIEISQDEVTKVRKAYNEMKIFVNENKDELKNEGFDIFINIMEMNEIIGAKNYFNKLKDYLNAFQEWLLYSHDNFDSIINRKDPETKEYNSLYVIYQFALSEMNDDYLQNQKALKEYLEKHPEYINHVQQAQKRLEKIGN